MQNKSLALYLQSKYINNISLIKQYLKKDYEDFIVFSNEHLILDKEYAVLPTIYLKFFKGDVVFFDPYDYLEKNDILANKKYLAISSEDLLQSKVSVKDLKEVTLLELKNNSIERIDYARL
jgi:hypothetical protein